MKRVLGIDNGERRIGVALFDDPTVGARPLTTLAVGSRDTVETLAQRLAELARAHEARGFVVGLPLRLDGRESVSSRKARALAVELKRVSKLPVALFDERLSTVQAQRARYEAGARGESARARIDEHAATLVLQSWVDAQASKKRLDETAPASPEAAGDAHVTAEADGQKERA